MKNEVMAKAITGIDDELIVSAHTNTVSGGKKRKWIYICAAEACLIALFFAILSTRHKGEMKILINGTAVSDEPVFIDVPAPLTSDMRQTTSQAITVPIELIINGNSDIQATDGTIEVSSAESEDMLCVGRYYMAEESVNVRWTIEDAEFNQSYQLRLKNGVMVLVLSYDKNTGNWKIMKQ
ncbi:MAG: hypothetical protein HFI34_09340 [Lachnospiraceae bacterium]|nr:hypothetical protein [Lachnospiraceae bacterium]